MLLTGLSIQPQPLSKVLPERERTLREALALVQRGFDDARDAADAILPAMSRGGAALQADAAERAAERAREAALQAEEAARNDALYARLQRQHEEHQRRQPEATALRE